MAKWTVSLRIDARGLLMGVKGEHTIRQEGDPPLV